MSTDNKDGNRRRSKGNSSEGRGAGSRKPSGNRPYDKSPGRKRYDSDRDDNQERRNEGDRPRPRKSFDKSERPSRFSSDTDRPKGGDRERSGDRPRSGKPFEKRERPTRSGGDTDRRDDKSRDRKSFENKEHSSRFKSDDRRSDRDGGENFATSRENYDKQHGRRKFERTEDTPVYKSKFDRDRGRNKPYKGKRGGEVLPTESTERDNRIRLNKYLSNSGLCTRREADEFIASGMVEVNGKTITEMGFKVNPGDVVKYAGERLSPEKPIYVLMNKPKDFVTTMKDYKGSSTVKQLMRGVGTTNILPVGKLDRGTTGLIMFTNDGDLAKKLTHPKHNVKKLYHVLLDKNVKEEHLIQLVEGVELEGGTMAADVVSYVGDGKDKREVGVEIHGGKNRVLTQLFEGLGYKVMKLDRVVFAGLTKKDLPRGHWRFLTEQEINNLKMLK